MLYRWKEQFSVFTVKQALRGAVASWCRNREVCGEERVNTWEELKWLLKEEFVPIDYDDVQLEGLAQLKQDKSIRQYVEKFRTLCESLPKVEDPVARSHFKTGLREQTRKACGLLVFANLDELIRYAIKYEEIYFPNEGRPQNTFRNTRISLNAMTCYNCNRSGHIAKQCLVSGHKRSQEKIRFFSDLEAKGIETEEILLKYDVTSAIGWVIMHRNVPRPSKEVRQRFLEEPE